MTHSHADEKLQRSAKYVGRSTLIQVAYHPTTRPMVKGNTCNHTEAYILIFDGQGQK